MKIVINRCYGAFSLSEDAVREYASRTGTPLRTDHGREISRTDPVLVALIEEAPVIASGRAAQLEICEIPDDVNWQIDEYDGIEWVAEVHRTWVPGEDAA